MKYLRHTYTKKLLLLIIIAINFFNNNVKILPIYDALQAIALIQVLVFSEYPLRYHTPLFRQCQTMLLRISLVLMLQTIRLATGGKKRWTLAMTVGRTRGKWCPK